MEIRRAAGGLLQTNTYVLISGDDTVLIDPGCEISKIRKRLDGRRVNRIFLTHGHLDHTYFMDDFKREDGAEIYMHRADEPFLTDFDLSSPGGVPDVLERRKYTVDRWINDGEIYNVGDSKFKVIHTPGHTPGGCMFYFEKEKVLFSGDTIFRGTRGRTDFPLSSTEEIENSIRKVLSMLPDDVVIYPGHAFPTTVANEKELWF